MSQEVTEKIAEKIWKNECGGKLEALTCWNEGESFGSFGIGHFIWYPAGEKKFFQETFPELLKFFQNAGIVLPSWLSEADGCLWPSREAFYENFHSQKMVVLRDLLLRTKNLQASFIVSKVEKVFKEIEERLAKDKRGAVLQAFHQLTRNPNGMYALVDYLNFKGAGISPEEAYQGYGWGLLQVLQGLSPNADDVVADFAASAKKVLARRVANSPPGRHEERWLKGWYNRINTYLELF